MDPRSRILVRQAVLADVTALVEVETQVYGPLGTPLFDASHFLAWFDIHPAGLLVAECDGGLVGYKYSQLVDFGFDRMDRFRTYDQATDSGYTRRTHKPGGNAFKGVSLCSKMPGAGRALFEATFALVRALGKDFYFSFTRMAGFDKYMSGLEDAQAQAVPPEEDVALWYAWQCVKLTGGKVWPTAPAEPKLILPALLGPDPVLCKQMRLDGFGLAGIRSGCMRDPQSRDHAAFMVYANPRSSGHP